MVLSHYGWLGSPRQPVTPMGIVGVIVLVVGVILTRR
jgi:transporter family-2 protein